MPRFLRLTVVLVVSLVVVIAVPIEAKKPPTPPSPALNTVPTQRQPRAYLPVIYKLATGQFGEWVDQH